MKRIFLIILTSWVVVANAGTVTSLKWPTVTDGEADAIDDRIERMLAKVSRHNNESSDVEYLHNIFKKTQKEFLHRYKQYADLSELVNGEFDCLTATSLFSAVLTKAGYSYRIVETNYHIFLLVATEEGEVLLETTDRFSGFITSEDEIAKRIKNYKAQAPNVEANRTAYAYDFQVFGEIGAAQLTGLLYFNQAVKAYNEGAWLTCSEKILAANKHYASPRVTALASVLLYTVSVCDVTETEKQSIHSRLRQFDQTAYTTANR